MGLLTWWRLQWKQYTCPHDQVETMHLFLEGVRCKCSQCGLVWYPQSGKEPK